MPGAIFCADCLNGHWRALQQVASSLTQQAAKSRNISILMRNLALNRFKQFRHAHSVILTRLQINNKEFVSRFLWVAFLVTVPSGACANSALWSGKLGSTERLIAIYYLVILLIVWLMSAIFFTIANGCLCRKSDYLFTIQIHLLGSDIIREKVNLMYYYELINSRDKLGYSVGVLAVIGRESFFQVF